MSRRKKRRAPALPQNKKEQEVKKHTLRRYWESEISWLFLVCLLAAGTTIFARSTPLLESKTRLESPSMLFVGDIMLARSVETLMNTQGTSYPFRGMRDVLPDYDAVVGNFEASIPERHVPTPSFGFTFSVPVKTAETLSRSGITHLTLANNHSYDYGEGGYTHTRKTLTSAGLAVAGNPRTLSSDEVLYHTLDDLRVAIIPINTIGETPSIEQSTQVLADAAQKSDVQIVSIHWGTEYELVANDSQRLLARLLVDSGADAIIGHHPHVVQDIEEYRGAPIFYSLGNYIFDQYWNTDVQEGLAVSLSFTADEIHYALIPLSSVGERSSPRPMNRIERLQFLDALAGRSEAALANAVRKGSIVELFNRKEADNLLD